MNNSLVLACGVVSALFCTSIVEAGEAVDLSSLADGVYRGKIDYGCGRLHIVEGIPTFYQAEPNCAGQTRYETVPEIDGDKIKIGSAYMDEIILREDGAIIAEWTFKKRGLYNQAIRLERTDGIELISGK